MSENTTCRRLIESDYGEMERIFLAAYRGVDAPTTEYTDFVRETKQALSASPICVIEYFGMFLDNRLVSFAGLGRSLFYDQSFEMRWDTTDPEFQQRGLMTKLIVHRLRHAMNVCAESAAPGIIQVASRHPSLYLAAGFRAICERGPRNAITYLVRDIPHDAQLKASAIGLNKLMVTDDALTPRTRTRMMS
jgi:hypothetical protein